MSSEIRLRIGEYDWAATRLTSRKYYPPSLSRKAAQVENGPLPADGGISRFTPDQISIPGVVGFGVEFGPFKGHRSLLLRIAVQHPFADEVRLLAKRSLAQWNDIFNTWDIPILSQTLGKALGEIWNWIEEAYFEIPWTVQVLELHWAFNISDKALRVLEGRIEALNNFWENGVVDFNPAQIDLVYGGLERGQIESGALAAFRELQPQSQWEPQTERSLAQLCVNYLRHQKSAYPILLKTSEPYLKTFVSINQAIAQAYPWLRDEAQRQITVKVKKLNEVNSTGQTGRTNECL